MGLGQEEKECHSKDREPMATGIFRKGFVDEDSSQTESFSQQYVSKGDYSQGIGRYKPVESSEMTMIL